jgi:hypothetical protein
MSNANKMTSSTFSKLQLACRYWGLGQRQTSDQAAKVYYLKAYTIIRHEMGEENPITLELYREMAR